MRENFSRCEKFTIRYQDILLIAGSDAGAAAQHRANLGSKTIFHLESFMALDMAFLEDAMDNDDMF